MKSYDPDLKLFNEISNFKKIALSLHVSPDIDSIGSNLAFANVFRELNIDVDIFSPDPVSSSGKFLSGADLIIDKDIKDVELTNYDALICLDAQYPKRLTRTTDELKLPDNIIVIDHHVVFGKGEIKGIIDSEIGSCSELLYLIFSEWGIALTRNSSTSLLAGMIGDTGSFRFKAGVTPQTFEVASKLLAKGADLGDITFNLTQRVPLQSLKFWSEVWEKMEIIDIADKKMVYARIPHEFYLKYSSKEHDGVTSKFTNSIEGTDFGLYISEENKGEVKGSFRSRTDVDVSIIAKELGGGGHKAAAGFMIVIPDDQTFEDVEKRILLTIKEVLNGKKEK
jgi:bifunctional oligoribonuclease and PAP phosphatase NrnA